MFEESQNSVAFEMQGKKLYNILMWIASFLPLYVFLSLLAKKTMILQ